MKCTNCGSDIEPNDKICSSCGQTVKETASTSSSNSKGGTTAPIDLQETAVIPKMNEPKSNKQDAYRGTPEPRPNMYSQNLHNNDNIDENGEPVSVLRWVGRMFLTWIPIFGGLINFIMLIVWACSDRFEKTSRNWAMAKIIMILIKAVIFIIISIVFAGVVNEVLNDPEFQRDMQTFLNSIPSV